MDIAATIQVASQIVSAIIKAAPIIEQGVVDAEPYVQAIVALVKNGGQPTAADWAAVNARLDAASAVIAQRALDAADPNKD
jgi:hypothetical protein